MDDSVDRPYHNSFRDCAARRWLGRETEVTMASKSKDARSHVKMVSSESPHVYYLQKNRNNTKNRMELRKYDPIVRKHVMYKEGK